MQESDRFEFTKARDSGVSMRAAMGSLFKNIGFDPANITTYGAAVFDVEFGPEIEMLRAYKPPFLLVSEPMYTSTESDRLKSTLKRESILNLSEGMVVEFFDGSPIRAIEYLRNLDPHRKVSLCTMLNAFPEYAYHTSTLHLIELSGMILIPGGFVIVSVIEEEYVRFLENASGIGVSGFSLSFHEAPTATIPTAGVGFLVAVKDPL